MAELYHSITEENSEEINLSLVAIIEALLFVAPTAVTISQLAGVLQVTPSKISRALDELGSIYAQPGIDRGLRIQRHSNRVQLTTAPETAKWIESFLGLEIVGRLSRAGLEALAIVVYQQPVTRPQIDAIRGVNSDGVIKKLLNAGLIFEVGRASTPGRPILYSTSSEFLQHFGLSSLDELPALDLEFISLNGGNSNQE